jgi:hypothetical protein
MNVVWGIRWDRDDDRRRGLLLAAALLAALAAVALLSFSRGASHGPLQAVIVRAEPNELAAAAPSASRCPSSTDSSHRCRPAPSAPSARRTAWQAWLPTAR